MAKRKVVRPSNGATHPTTNESKASKVVSGVKHIADKYFEMGNAEEKKWLQKQLASYYSHPLADSSTTELLCVTVSCYFASKLSKQAPTSHSQKYWATLTGLFRCEPSKTFMKNYQTLTPSEQVQAVSILFPCVCHRRNLLLEGPLLFSRMYNIIFNDTYHIIEFEYIQRKIQLFQSRTDKHGFRIAYSFERSFRLEAICKSKSESAQRSTVIAVTKKLRVQIKNDMAAELTALLSYIPKAVLAKHCTDINESLGNGLERLSDTEVALAIPRPQCVPSDLDEVSPAFRRIVKSHYLKNPEDQAKEKKNESKVDPYFSAATSFYNPSSTREPFPTLTLDESGEIVRNLENGRVAFLEVFQSKMIAPETFVPHYLPSSILSKEAWFRTISSNEACIRLIFEKLTRIQNASRDIKKPFLLSPQEEAVLALPDNVLLLGRSGTGKTTCALLRMFARYRLFEENKKNNHHDFPLEYSDHDTTQTDHYHPIFITLSPVLCSQAKKYFHELQGNETTESAPLPSDLFLDHTDFPLFATLRQFLKMLDGTLVEAFFYHESDHNEFNWKNEDDQGLVQIIRREFIPIEMGMEDLIEENNAFLHNSANWKEFEASLNEESDQPMQMVSHNRTSFEITYDYFKKEIYSGEEDASLVWTEIQSHIKGSLDALQTNTGFLSLHQYTILLGKKRSLISKGKRAKVYSSFLAYEQRKRSMGAFDLQDIIYHIYNRIQYEGYRGSVVDSITIDEVQDFSQSTLQLLMSICKQENGFFFTGDTCQTIARGVGFRFRELQTLFHFRLHRIPLLSHHYTIPEVHQLTINFRSHSALIQLGNSIIHLLEDFFPSTIDILAEDQGSLPGPLPSVMKYDSDEELFAFLYGSTENGNISSHHIEQFGAHQVVITRNQATKADLPDLLKHALCLTVFESKGLEFDDVILFNFFTDSPASARAWKHLYQKKTRTKPQILGESGLVHVGREEEEDQMATCEISPSEMLANAQDSLPERMDHGSDDGFNLLCSELKHLYVGITRARKNLYIFEKDMVKARPIFTYWTSRPENTLIRSADISKIGKGIVESTSAAQWKQQGKLMLQNHYYPQAMQCFTYANEENLFTEANALLLASQAAELEKSQFSAINHEDKQARVIQAKDRYRDAAEQFLSISCVLKGAQCLEAANEFLRAAALFEKILEFVSAAKCYVKVDDFLRAAQCYVQANERQEAVRFFVRANAWSLVLDTLSQSNDMDLKEYAMGAIDFFAAQTEIEWPEMIRAISLLSPSLAIRLREVLSDFNLLTIDLLDVLQKSPWKLSQVSISLLTFIQRKTGFLLPIFYKRLHSYIFASYYSMYKAGSYLAIQGKLLGNSLPDHSLRLHYRTVASVVKILDEPHQLQMVLSFGDTPIIPYLFSGHQGRSKEVKDDKEGLKGRREVPFHSLEASRQLQAAGLYSSVSAPQNEGKIQILLDEVYDLLFCDSLVVPAGKELEMAAKPLSALRSLLLPTCKPPSNFVKAYELIYECFEVSTKREALFSYFNQERKWKPELAPPSPSTLRAARYFIIVSFQIIRSKREERGAFMLPAVCSVLQFLTDSILTLQNPSVPFFESKLLSILFVCNVSPAVASCVGFPHLLSLPRSHLLSKLISCLDTCHPRSQNYHSVQYRMKAVLQTISFLFLNTAASLLRFSCHELVNPFSSEDEPISKYIEELMKYVAIVEQTFRSLLPLNKKGLGNPSQKVQWLMNERSILSSNHLSFIIKQKIRPIFISLWSAQPSPSSTCITNSLIIIATSMWEDRFLENEKGNGKAIVVHKEQAQAHFFAQLHRSYALLYSVGKEMIMYEWIRFARGRGVPPARYPLTCSLLSHVSLCLVKIKLVQRKGNYFEAIQLANELLLFCSNNEEAIYFVSAFTEDISTLLCSASVLFSIMDDKPIILPSWYEAPSQSELPPDFGILMECILELLHFCVLLLPSLHTGEQFSISVPLILLSYNCGIPSLEYDEEMLNMVWRNRDDFFGPEDLWSCAFLDDSPLVTGYPSELSVEELKNLICEEYGILHVDIYPMKENQTAIVDATPNATILDEVKRINAAHVISSAFKKNRKGRRVAEGRPATFVANIFDERRKEIGAVAVSTASLSILFVELVESYYGAIHMLGEVEVPEHVLYDVSSSFFHAGTLLWNLSNHFEIVLGEYQTVLAQTESEMTQLIQKMKEASALFTTFRSANPVEENTPGSALWRQNQIQKLLKQRQGLRKQNALQRKAARNHMAGW